MGYEFICGIPMAVVAALAIVLGLFVMWERVEDWANANKQAQASKRNRKTVWITFSKKNT
jgi:hypothetical protein